MSGVIGDPDRATAVETFIDNMRFAADLVAGSGIKIVVEPLNQRDMPGYFISHQMEAVELVKRVERPNIGVQLDYYHAQIMDGDLTRLTEAMGETIGHVQIASVPDRHEPDEGEVNFAHLFATLDRIGYSGWIGCEYNPRGDTRAGLGWRDAYH